ncbi:MAG: hypothetical protein H6609_17945 [Ignavibacteriales bacterium]|nr:hypothetical protein [Ignavibacteriales bacterium]
MRRVKKSSIYITEIRKNQEEKKYLFSETRISKDGNNIEEKSFYKNGQLKESMKTVMDKRSEIFTNYSYNKNGKLVCKIEYQEVFDEDGNLLNQKIFENGKLQSEEEYNYENGKKLVSKIMKDDEGNKYTTKINYNENKTESDLLFKTNNETEIRLEIIYEEKHRKEISNTYNSYDEFLGRTISYFDENNSPIKYERFDKNENLISTSNYIYNELGLIESADFDKDQNVIERIRKIYDDNGLIKQTVIENFSEGLLNEKEISEWEYEFYDN